jgi:membrane-associated phospholipid phosphatase
LLVLNALMMASTPIEGTHYFVDVIGGVIVSMCSVLAATWARHRVGLHYAVGTAQRAAPGASRAVALDAALSLGNDA